MIREHKFDLTWSQPTGGGEPEPRLKFEVFDKAKEATVTYAAVFRVCATPRCGGRSVCTHCSPLLPDGSASPGLLRWFWLDVGNRVLEMTPELQADAETLRLAELVSSRLGETAWEDLHRWFWTAKTQAIETAEVDEIDIADLPSADDGHMIPFIEVFPLGLSLNFTFENAAWAADEQVPASNRGAAVRISSFRFSS